MVSRNRPVDDADGGGDPLLSLPRSGTSRTIRSSIPAACGSARWSVIRFPTSSPIVAANRIGTENGQTFYGHSFIADERGDYLASFGREETGC
jgi:hypothetical protein